MEHQIIIKGWIAVLCILLLLWGAVCIGFMTCYFLSKPSYNVENYVVHEDFKSVDNITKGGKKIKRLWRQNE